MDTKALSGIVWREAGRGSAQPCGRGASGVDSGHRPVLAARIEAFVREKGALEAPKELLNVEGIGPAKLREIEKIAVAD
jgi:hypothetical protein